MRYFWGSLFISLVGFLTSFIWGGWRAFAITLILALLEISLSFDNAIVNATVLKKMSPVWQARFLTWGIFIAVFVVRLILPMAIVAISAKLSLWEVVRLALRSPEDYANHIAHAHASIATFGGMFLLLVFLSFLFNQQRDIHWLGVIEKKLNQIGKLNSMEVLIALLILTVAYFLVSESQQAEVLISGIVGIIFFVSINSITGFLETQQNTKLIKHTGLANFLYLELLDASFSIDGVVGAFAITQDIVIIMLGLMIGAMFVRSLTVFLTQHGTLSKYRFLEHGAHYAIGILSLIMLLSLVIHIPEIITGLIGISLIILALISSLRHNRLHKQ
jgi:hypothetical protein